MGGGGEGGSHGGGGKELIETVLTCEGNISDPELPLKISHLIHHLQVITKCDSCDWLVRKVEPWNSVRVTFSIPKEAAARLHQLAQSGDAALRQLGILSVQVEGDQIVSLKVAGPNNETTEILIRTEGVAGPSGEAASAHTSVARSVTQALGAGMLPAFGQQHHQPHPVPQFRSPSLVGSDGIPVVVGRSPVVQQRPQGQQGFAYTGVNPSSIQARHAQPSHQSPAGVLVSGGASLSHPASVVTRPVFPTNPPPPYPNQELRQPVNPPQQQQVASASQVTGQQQYANSQTGSSVVTPPPQVVLQHSSQQINSLAQSVTGSYRVHGSHASVATSANPPPSRGHGRTQVNMVKNSPLLVGLLQQSEHSSSTMGPRNNKSVAVSPSQTPSIPLSNSGPSSSVENGPLPSVISNTATATALASAGTYIGRSRDGLTTHQQIFSGGSVITNSAPPPPPPPPRHVANNVHQHPQLSAHQPSPSSPASRLQPSPDEPRRVFGSSLSSVGNKSGHLQPNVPPVIGPSNKDEQKESKSVHFSSSSMKKESQYLINPNTGLLEPRPNTDSSDSEPEGRIESPSRDDQRSNSLPSDNESNVSGASRKENDHSDSDVSRVPMASMESKKILSSERGRSQDPDSSPGSSWENNIVSSSPGEKIKLRLKLGKEQVAQTTIVGNANKKLERRDLSVNAGINSQSLSEPRVPKLHIKLHPSQPVIIKSIEETEASNRKSVKDMPSAREDKSKRKSGRTKPRNSEADFDLLKSRSLKLKVNKDKSCGDEVTSQFLKMLEPKRNKNEADFDDNSFLKYKEAPDSRVKVPRMVEVTKPSKVENKLRTRLKKPPMRKVGDLNSVGELTSHKIMENLPPSITKVAAMHTQQPHRNPNSSSPVPFSSISTSMFSGSSISASFSATTTTTTSSPSSTITSSPSGDHLKAELEKRGSEIIPKTDVKMEVDKSSSSDILMTKLRMSNPSLKNIMNGDVSHSEKVTINQMRFKRTGPLSSQSDFSPASKLTIKRKNSEEAHTLKALKKEGLGSVSVPTFLNSSVLINKVSPDKTSVSSLSGPHRQTDDISEKLMKKVETIKGPLRSEIAGLKSNSDITIHSVSKNDILGLTKGSDFDRRAELTIKTKPEVTKVGRVTCVDVMDRKALEEALKSSRNSSKKNDISFCKTTSSMVDRLRRWNSIDSSNSVPFSSNSQQQASDSTNLNSSAVKTESSKESGESESEKSVILSTVIEKVKSESISQQSNTIINVNSDNDCDNSSKDNLDKVNSNKSETNEVKKEATRETRTLVQPSENEVRDKPKLDSSIDEYALKPSQSDFKSLSSYEMDNGQSLKSGSEQSKAPDLGNLVTSVKSEVESPEGTPKGEHGNGQGEDSGIESMDALSEKSPNHSDQSPNRREEKDCEMFQERCKTKANALVKAPKPEEKEKKPSSVREEQASSNPPSGESGENFKVEKVSVNENVLEGKDPDSLHSLPDSKCSLKLNLNSGTNKAASEEVNSDLGGTSKSVESSKSANHEFIHECSTSKESNLNYKLDKTLPIHEKTAAGKKVDSSKENSITNASFSTLESSHCSSGTNKASLDSNKADNEAKSVSSGLWQASEFTSCESKVTSSVVVAPSDCLKHEFTSDEMSSSQDKIPESCSVSADTPLSDVIVKETNARRSCSLDSAAPLLCSASISITTTSLSVASPKSSVVTSPSVLINPSVTAPQFSNCVTTHLNQSSSKDSSCSPSTGCMSNSKESNLNVNSSYKPSLLAITLNRPPGANVMTSQYATSIANSVDKVTTTTTTTTTAALSKPPPSTVISSVQTTTSAVTKIVSSLETNSNTSIVYCHSISCNNNSLAYCNSYTTNTTNTTATMIILAASTNTSSSVITTPPNSTKVVTLKPGVNQTSNSAINHPAGKTFRLVALPGITPMAPAASPVKGQLVTLKPVIGSGVTPSPTKSSQLLQTIPCVKSEDSGGGSPILKTQLTSSLISSVETSIPSTTVLESISNETHLDDLDFVGFSNTPSENDSKDQLLELKDSATAVTTTGPPSLGKLSNKALPNILSPTEEEPTPMRLHPPLYTYGNRERKKEVESDAEEKDKDEGRELQAVDSPSLSIPKLLPDIVNDPDAKEEDEARPKAKDRKLHALTIEIPSVESLPDDKRLTRSTRHSARLASPKVNSPAGGELSPRLDKRSPAANSQTMGKPSPVGVLRSSVSPALRVTKRRRHESESSSASNVSEDQVEPPTKTVRRKGPERTLNDSRDDGIKVKSSNGKKEDIDKEKDVESSEDECLMDDDSLKRRNPSTASSSTNEDEEESRPSSRTGRSSKAVTRSRDRTIAVEGTRSTRDTTPTRRTPRQNRVGGGAVGGQAHTSTPLSLTGLSTPQEKSPESKDSPREPFKEVKERASPSPPEDPAKGDESFKEAILKEGDKKLQEKRPIAPPATGKEVVKTQQKVKRDSESEQDALLGRRKTRSTTNTATVTEDINKRRRLSKDK